MNIFKNLKISTKLYIGFGVVLAILVLMSIITYTNFQNFSESNKWDKHTYDVIGKLDKIVESLINMETGQRGFMLTGNEASLEPYNLGKDSYDKVYDEVKKITSDNQDQQELLTNMNDQVQEWLSIASTSIELRKQVGKGQVTMEDVVKLEQEAKGKAAMDKFREIIEESSKMEEDLLVVRGEESSSLENNTKNILIIGTVIAAVLTIIISVWISKMISNPINKLKVIAEKISLGDTNVKVDIDSKDEIGSLAGSFESVLDTLNRLTKEIKMLIVSSENGKLKERGNSSKFKGDWAEVINGLNGLLDKIIEPINEASEVLKEVSKGNLNISVNGEYKGDHAEIKKALNSTIYNIKSYINEISEVLTKVSNGNLTINIERKYLGNFSEIKDSINMIIQSFNKILADINFSAEQVATGSSQLSKSSQTLSQGSTEQASSIEEITSSIEEIANQTNDNDENASQANNIALTSKEDAISGNKQMEEMLKSMGEINDASGNISKIIKVIDEIAFQTNILALNAAVEAARAGQHGKGFAVVAEEVRNLAARSANAAKETTSLIEGSIKKVDIGTKIANDTAQALDKIVSGVAKVADIVGGIATASNEQSSGIKQINKAIEQVSKVTQTNSVTAAESASSSEELSSQADLLKNMISKFIINKDDHIKIETPNKNTEEDKFLALSGTATKPKISLDIDDDYGKY